jgi:hypothetical protein
MNILFKPMCLEILEKEMLPENPIVIRTEGVPSPAEADKPAVEGLRLNGFALTFEGCNFRMPPDTINPQAG